MENPLSKVERVKLSGRETVTHLATVDDLIICKATGPQEPLVVEFVRWDAKGKPVESYRITLCPEDAARIRCMA